MTPRSAAAAAGVFLVLLVMALANLSTEQGEKAAVVAPRSCSTDDLPYNRIIKEQIAELCAANFTRNEAIRLIGIYVGNGGNPAQAARIVKIGRDVEAVRRDPLLLHLEKR